MSNPHNAREGKKCAACLRTNQKRQAVGHCNHSIDHQKEYLMDWACREGMEVVEVYSDVGKSGSSISGCNGLRRMLNDVITHKLDIDYVLVSEPSRLGRNMKGVSDALSILRANGVNLLYPGYNTEINIDCFNRVCGSMDFARLCR